VVTDGKGTPLIAQLTPGQQHESTYVESLLDAFQIPQSLGRPRSRPEQLAGDKAYSIPRIRQFLRDRGIRAVIPHKENERASRDGRVRFDKVAYRQRCVIEQCVGWLKECRRIGTRFDKLAVNFHGMVTLAMIGRYLKLLFSDRA
jgi:transposase